MEKIKLQNRMHKQRKWYRYLARQRRRLESLKHANNTVLTRRVIIINGELASPNRRSEDENPVGVNNEDAVSIHASDNDL